MKAFYLALLFLFLSGSLGAQETVGRDRTYEQVFQVTHAKSAGEVFGRAQRFVAEQGMYVTESKSNSLIRAKFELNYKSSGNQCIEALDIRGNLKFEFKGNKTRITLEHLVYTHKDKNDGSEKPVARSNIFTRFAPCAPASGKIEQLYDCGECKKSIRSLKKALEDSFDEQATKYQKSLRKKDI